MREELGSGFHIAFGRDHHVNDLPVLVDGAIHVSPGACHLHVGLIYEPPVPHRTAARTGCVDDQRSGALHPPIHGDMGGSAAANNLRTTRSYAVRSLTDPSGNSVLVVDRNALELVDDGRLRVDAWQLEAELDRGRRAERTGGIADALAAYRRAAACWRSDPVHEMAAAPWLEDPLGDIRAAFVEAATRAAELLVGRYDEAALGLATRALAADRWAARASDVTVRAHAGLGRDAAARQALSRHRVLVAGLGLDDAHLAPLATVVAQASLGRRP